MIFSIDGIIIALIRNHTVFRRIKEWRIYYNGEKNIDWENIGFGYIPTDKRFVANYKDGAWDEGGLTEDPNIVMNECAGVLQYAQTVFEGMKAYTTEDGHIITFRPTSMRSEWSTQRNVLRCRLSRKINSLMLLFRQ